MYAYIKGIISAIDDGILVIECNGIGYEVFISNLTATKLTVGDSATLYTYLSVKEDEMSLFGFLNKTEKALFSKLISVNGIGPKLALSLLGGMPVDSLVENIVTGNATAICTIKGVGKKMAERIVMELKEKLDACGVNAQMSPEISSLPPKAENAVQTLIALGIRREDAIKAVMEVYNDSLTVNQIIHGALNR